MGTPAKAGREYWRSVLVAGGSTAIPRWTLDPVPGVGECTVALPEPGRGTARAGGEPVSSGRWCWPRTRWSWRRCRVSGTWSPGMSPQAAGCCRAGWRPSQARGGVSWRRRPGWRRELLRHADVAVEDLRREMGVAGPSFTTLFDPAGTAT